MLECERVCAYVHQILYFRKDINSLHLVQKKTLSLTLQVTAPLSASLKSGKQGQGLKQLKPLPADGFSAVLLYRV